MVIRLLSTDVSSKIAAGEVIERPFSVVKELVENSLDAGATDVSVEIRGGGVESIRVVDNGSGIPGDQVDMAFRRFATSKVARAEDLESISTLGFRGEALPSIAAVSKVSMITRAAESDAGSAHNGSKIRRLYNHVKRNDEPRPFVVRGINSERRHDDSNSHRASRYAYRLMSLSRPKSGLAANRAEEWDRSRRKGQRQKEQTSR